MFVRKVYPKKKTLACVIFEKIDMKWKKMVNKAIDWGNKELYNVTDEKYT